MILIVTTPARGSAAWHEGRHHTPLRDCSSCRREHPGLFPPTRREQAAARRASFDARLAYVRGSGPYRPEV